VNKRPGQTLAFLPEADVDTLAETLLAFANADGGLIVLGVDEEGQPTESIWDEEAEGALRAALGLCEPPIATEWQRLESRHGPLIGIRVSRSPNLHSAKDGRVLVRHGVENRPITGAELTQLANSHNVGAFEAEIVPGARFDDLDTDIFDEYLTKREGRGAARVTRLEDLLFEIGATDREGRPTVMGVLLFGRNPQAFLPQSGITFVKFADTEPRDADGKAGYGRRDELGGPLARMVERAWNIVWEEMRVGARIRNLEREEIPEYPRFAVREAIVNAACHRDYRVRGRRIEIRMYSDRLEVISPGGLAGYMTLDNLVEEHYSRNPLLVNGLFQWGYIEELGLGIDRMIEDMVAAGHPPPKFRATSYSFTVTLERNENERRAAVPTWSHSMNERQTRALTYVRESGSITNREYQRLCSDVSAETLRRDLADLVKRGILLKIGSKKGTTYILK
jgi:ATP-dependent DNA helicase RecG